MPILPTLLLLGCHTVTPGIEKPTDYGSNKDDDTGSGGGCTSTSTVVDGTVVTSLGFSAADLIAQVGGVTSQPLSWLAAEEDTLLTLDVAWTTGEVRFVDQESDGTGLGDTGGSNACGDWLEVDVNVGFSTDDGVFAESWPLTLQASGVDRSSFTQDLDAVTLTGTFDKWDYADPTADYASLGAAVGGVLAPGGGYGAVTLAGEGWEDPDCQHDGCVAWESRETAATWGESGS